MAEERDLTRNQRVVLSVAIWVVVGPLCFGFFLISWPLGLVMMGVAIWTTWDYIRKGGMAGHVSEGMSKSGLVGKGAEELFGREGSDE